MYRKFGCFFLVLIIVVLAVSLLPQRHTPNYTAYAQGIVQARVTPDNLNVRARPGPDAPQIGRFTRDTILAIEGREDQQGNGGVWVFGSPVAGGTRGWVLSEFLEFPATFVMESLPVIEAEGAAVETVTGDTGTTPPPAAGPEGSLSAATIRPANFRSGPGTNYSIIATLQANTPVAIVGRNSSSTWLKAIVNGQEGWLYYTLITINGDANGLPVLEASAATSAGTGSTPVSAGAPGYSAANLRVFSYGAHVSSFAFPDLMHYAGMTWAKKQIRYSRGQDASSVTGHITDSHAKGFRIMLSVVGHAGDVATGGDAYFQEYASFVAGVAALGADAIEIWNEPNLDREWPTGMIDPAMYTRLLALSYNAIKATNPGVIVISAAPSPTGAEGLFGLERVWNDNRYLAGMRAAGAGLYMDCLGAHYNEGIVGPTQTSGDPRGDNYYTRYFWGMVNTYRAIFPGKPICFTELGYVSPEGYGTLPAGFIWGQGTTVAQQALWLDQVIALARGSGVVKIVIIWNMDFTGSFGGDPLGGYAIIRPNGTCPACDALAR